MKHDDMKDDMKHNEDREEFRTFRKEYEIDRGVKKIQRYVLEKNLVQIISPAGYYVRMHLHDIQKNTKTIKHDSPQALYINTLNPINATRLFSGK